MSTNPITILMVEDNPGDARLLRETLVDAPSFNFEMMHCVTLGDALNQLAELCFDIILLDLSLPDAHGLETVSRAHEHAPGTAIVVLTGLNDSEMGVQSLRAGAQDYLVKGQVDTDLLVRAIRYAMERKRGEDEVHRQLQRVSALREIGMAMGSSLDLTNILNVLVENIALLFPDLAVSVQLLNGKNGRLESVAFRNLEEAAPKGELRGAGQGIAHHLLQANGPVVIADILASPHLRDADFVRRNGLVSCLGTPLLMKGAALGVILFYSRDKHEFSREEIDFLVTVAGQAAIAINNSQVYEEMAKLAENLTRSNKVKDEFLGVVSHELRTPVNVIRGYAEIVKQGIFGEINAEQAQGIQRIVAQSDHLLGMLTNVLEATRIDAEQVELRRDEFDPAQVLDELKTVYENRTGKEPALVWNYPATLPYVKSDRGKLRQVFRNLIDNAIKFTEKGSVTIAARNLREERGVEFNIEDTGVGIEQEFLPVIFEKFRQADSSNTRAHEGMGIGLYIVKEFMTMLGGQVEVRSAAGKGSTFTVKLPCEGKEPRSISQIREL